MRLLNRVLVESENWLRWHPVARTLLFRQKLRKARKRLVVPRDARSSIQSIERLCEAARLAPNEEAMQEAEVEIREHLGSLDISKVDWREFVPNVQARRIEKAVVLKPRISLVERGVVLISFEDQWARLLYNCNLKQFSESYTLVVSPSWSPPHSLINCVFPVVYPGPIFCLISNTSDLKIFARLSASYLVMPLFASSWVNPDLYKPVPFEKKDICLLMLANFGKYKRHFLLFQALKEMPADLRVLLVGREEGLRTSETILAEARAYGVENRFKLMVNASNATVLDALSRAKTTVILSQREGSCIAVVESMFANTPVGIFEDAEIGSRVYINELTGRFLRHRNLGKQLTDFVASAHAYSPRAFAEKRISCFHSTKALNATLKAHALASGEEWTQDIATHHRVTDPELSSAKDRARMQSAYDDIKMRFGITLGRD